MENLANKILDLLNETDDKTALKTLSEVVRAFDLNVAANLIANNYDPSLMTKGSLEECYYSEGNEEAGHIPLVGLLQEVEKVINLDDCEKDIKFEDALVRKYTDEELKEEHKENDGITWYKRDEDKKILDVLIGFETV